MQKKLFPLVAMLFLSWATEASIFMPNDKKYYVLKTGTYTYIFTSEYKPLLPDFIHYNEYFEKEYRASFDWHLDERVSLILASTNNQTPNGYASPMPNLHSVFYPSGSLLQDRFAAPSWLYILLIHESAHLYQTNMKASLPGQLKTVFGNPVFVPILIAPVFIHSNIFIPTFLLEGNAVLNESRFGLGGRLYSGEARALAFAQLKDGKFNPTRWINDHIDFPFGQEKYIQGGYFQLYLAESFGVEKTNQFFKEQTRNFIFVNRLDNSFKNHFDASYSQLTFQYTQTLGTQADQQQSSPETAIIKSYNYAPMNHDSNSIYFLSSESGRSTPQLNIYDKNSGQWTQRKKDLPYEKLFLLEDGLFYSRSSEQINSTQVRHSLFGEALRYRPDYSSKFVEDIRAEKTLYTHAEESFVEQQLYLNDEHLGPSHSSAILDQEGRAYYFRQYGTQRHLMRDQEELFSFKGYYGKPMEVDGKGRVYFIAASSLGSSLYVWMDSQIYRLSHSDTIVDARLIDATEQTFLICEVTAQGYEYKIISTSPYLEPPAYYHYFFEEDKAFNTFTDIPDPKKDYDEIESEIRRYHGLRELKYSALNIIYSLNDHYGPTGSLLFHLTDPLQYNSLNLGYSHGSYNTHAGLFRYTYSRYRLAPYIGYYYDERVLRNFRTNTTIYKYKDHDVFAGFNYDLWRWRRWSSQWDTQASWLYEDRFFAPPLNEYSLRNTLNLRRTQAYPFSFDYYRLFSLALSHKALTDKYFNKTDSQLQALSSVTADLGWETFLNLQAAWGVGEKQRLKIRSTPLFYEDAHDFVSLIPGTNYQAREVQAFGLGLKKAINTSLYFPRIPLSLRRWAPIANYQYFHLNKPAFSRANSYNFDEWQLGVTLELLLLHKIPLQTTLSFLNSDTENLSYSPYLQLSSQWGF